MQFFPTGGARWGVNIEDYVDPDPRMNANAASRPVGAEKMGLGWGYQLLPYLEEGALHGIHTTERLRETVVPIYVCPSRRGIVRSENADGGTVLSDYTGFQPCTRVRTSNTASNPVDITQITYGYGGPNSVLDVFYQTNLTTPRGGVYDGVIVRSPWRRNNLQDAAIAGIEGRWVENVPRATKMAKITDGTSKTLMIGEKYIRSDLYETGHPSDDTGATDGWDPDIMRVTCVSPLNDGDTNPPFTGNIGDPPGFNGIWEIVVAGSAHPGGFNCVFADGSVHSISYDIDIFVFNALGTRNGAETFNMDGVN